MRGLVLLLVVSAALAAPQTRPSATPEGRACNEALRGVEEQVANKATVSKCIGEQPGLQATLEQLRASSTVGGPHKGFPTILLAEAGMTTEATTLRKCIARENQQLTTSADGSQVFDVAKFQADLIATVAGTTSETNTNLGIQNCSTAPLQSFEVFKYMKCIKSYCATGAEPTN